MPGDKNAMVAAQAAEARSKVREFRRAQKDEAEQHLTDDDNEESKEEMGADDDERSRKGKRQPEVKRGSARSHRR